MTEKQLGDLPFDQQHLIRFVVEDLEAQFAGTFGVGTIERFVKERLTALGKVDGSLPSSTPGVLFLCVHDAGRLAPSPRGRPGHGVLRWLRTGVHDQPRDGRCDGGGGDLLRRVDALGVSLELDER